jgi:ATP-binding cassette subfamily F protein 3
MPSRDAAPSRRQERRAEALARQRLADARKPFEKRLAQIESRLEPLAREAAEIETWLQDPQAYDASQREALQERLRRRGELNAAIAALEDDWLWTQAEMDRAVKEPGPPPAPR